MSWNVDLYIALFQITNENLQKWINRQYPLFSYVKY